MKTEPFCPAQEALYEKALLLVQDYNFELSSNIYSKMFIFAS